MYSHKTHFISSANCYMFQQQGAIFREFIEKVYFRCSMWCN